MRKKRKDKKIKTKIKINRKRKIFNNRLKLKNLLISLI